MTRNSTQISAATALVQLLTEHPELSEHLTWSISRTSPVLVGYIHDGGMRVLADCADFLGGSIRAGVEHGSSAERLRQHVLTARWRDVPVEIIVSVPVRSLAVAA
ncbi:hypothetical protein [Streptomyces sp. NK08204]|uniref:hypothetical protein n=1 Tax=Streptomyces sp. NK08204 TaxID=2873260 RepID=UPI001CED2EE3|nr:hypothetical protein [Streptomyces sp. NK08204]